MKKLTDALKNNNFVVTYFDTPSEASAYLNNEIDKKTVGFGGSVTLQQLELYESLSAHNTVYWHWYTPSDQTPDEIRSLASVAEIYISSANAISETGEIVNIDGAGNRLSSIYYGHKKVYFVVGINKITPNLEDAIRRARNIAAPMNAKRLNRKTPCAEQGRGCYDCDSPERICNGLSVLYKKMMSCEMEVVLIGTNLGY